jgi:hypothetical protein
MSRRQPILKNRVLPETEAAVAAMAVAQPAGQTRVSNELANGLAAPRPAGHEGNALQAAFASLTITSLSSRPGDPSRATRRGIEQRSHPRALRLPRMPPHLC